MDLSRRTTGEADSFGGGHGFTHGLEDVEEAFCFVLGRRKLWLARLELFVTDETELGMPDHAAFGWGAKSFRVAVDAHVNVAFAETAGCQRFGLVHDTVTGYRRRSEHRLVDGKAKIASYAWVDAGKRTRGEILAHHFVTYGGCRGSSKVDAVPVASLWRTFALSRWRVSSRGSWRSTSQTHTTSARRTARSASVGE